MRVITFIIIHCSAVRPWQQSSVQDIDIDRWHRARGWKNGCGYHYVVRRNGTVETGRPLVMIGSTVKTTTATVSASTTRVASTLPDIPPTPAPKPRR